MITDRTVLGERIDRLFRELVAVDSESKNERDIADLLSEKLTGLGMQIKTDSAGRETGSNADNLFGFLPGNRPGTILLSAHMDTVKPGNGIEVVFENGRYSSKGNTILAADDKAGIAIIIETVRAIVEGPALRPNIELLLTVCEEEGLLGAKHMDDSLLKSRSGIILDSTEIDTVIINAPSAIRMRLTVSGRQAHAGVNPEDGINAILIASRAIARMPIGRLDNETTVNIGTIKGGKATNIVPPDVVINGEIRSHNLEKLNCLKEEVIDIFTEECKKEGGHLEVEQYEDFPVLKLGLSESIVTTVMRAGEKLGRQLQTGSLGGGSDANILFGKGIKCAVLGTGMSDPHSVNESVSLDDMVDTAFLLFEIVTSFEE